MEKLRPKTKVDINDLIAGRLKEVYAPLNITEIINFLAETALNTNMELKPSGGITIVPRKIPPAI